MSELCLCLLRMPQTMTHVVLVLQTFLTRKSYLTINKDNGDVGHNEDIAGTQHVLPNTLFNSAYKRPSLCKGKEK